LTEKRAIKAVDQPPTTTLFRYKKLIERQLEGIPILGSRVMITYSANRPSFRKALGHWPSLTADGNVLRTSLTPQQAAEAVANYLIQTDETDVQGPIVLRYVYQPESAGPGYIRVRLMIEATLVHVQTGVETHNNELIRVRYVDAGANQAPDGIGDETGP
jgi:hypothetical protein